MSVCLSVSVIIFLSRKSTLLLRLALKLLILSLMWMVLGHVLGSLLHLL